MTHVLVTSEKRWTKYMAKDAPCGRYGHRTVVYGNLMILHGGYSGTDRLCDTYEYDMSNTYKRRWKCINTKGEIPSRRDCHSAVIYDSRMYIFGGGDGYQWLNDLFAYHIPTQTWSHVDAIGNIPSGRAGHSANVWKSSMIVFGGWDGQKTLNDLYSFDFGCNKWSKVHANGEIPQSRDSHTAIIYKDKMIIAGGGDGKKRLNDIFELNLCNIFDRELTFQVTMTWKKVECIGEVNAARAGHVACVYENYMIMFGGGDGVNWLSDIYELDMHAYKWTKIIAAGEAAPGSYGLSAAVHKNKMILFGGGDGVHWYNAIYEYKIGEEPCRREMRQRMFSALKNSVYTDVILEFNVNTEL